MFPYLLRSSKNVLSRRRFSITCPHKLLNIKFAHKAVANPNSGSGVNGVVNIKHPTKKNKKSLCQILRSLLCVIFIYRKGLYDISQGQVPPQKANSKRKISGD